MVNKFIKTKSAQIWIEDNILRCKLVPGAEITIDHAKEIVKETLRLCKGKKMPILGDMREAKYISFESRRYLSGNEAEKAAYALAMIANSPVSKVIGNFLIGINKPPYPVRLFTSKEKAIEWLKKFKDKL